MKKDPLVDTVGSDEKVLTDNMATPQKLWDAVDSSFVTGSSGKWPAKSGILLVKALK